MTARENEHLIAEFFPEIIENETLFFSSSFMCVRSGTTRLYYVSSGMLNCILAHSVVKVKVNIDLYIAHPHRRENITSNALRCGSHSVTCQSHHTCIYP